MAEYQTRKIKKEDLEFLSDLQHELNTQDTLCQADPRFWVIRGTQSEYGHPDGDPVVIVGGEDEYTTFASMKGLVRDAAKEVWPEYEDQIHVESEDYGFSSGTLLIRLEDGELAKFYDREEVVEFLKTHGIDAELTTKRSVPIIYPDTLFLTNKEAHRHLKANHYHYSEDAHTYAMTAWRSPQVEHLWKLLHEIDFSSIATAEREDEEKVMGKVIFYSEKDFEKYDRDLRYWSNGCGDLRDIENDIGINEDRLPSPLQRVYAELFEEGKDGNYMYLVNYRGKDGVALLNEYYDHNDGAADPNNFEQAQKVASYLADQFDYPVILAKELGFPSDGENATEVVIVIPPTISKKEFDRISKEFADVAYVKRK